MTCRYRDCTREPVRGWTTCAAHYSAGRRATPSVARSAYNAAGDRLAADVEVLASFVFERVDFTDMPADVVERMFTWQDHINAWREARDA